MTCTILVKEVPNRLDLQNFLDQELIGLKLQKSWELAEYNGFASMRLGGYPAGVEIYVGDLDSESFSEHRDKIGERKRMISLRFGNNISGACCAFAMAAAIVKHADGFAYCESTEPMSYVQIRSKFEELFVQAKKIGRNTPHKMLLDAVAAGLPNIVRRGNLFFYLPIGECARGIGLYPKGDHFEVSIFVWPLVAERDRLFVMSCPTDLNIRVHFHNIYQPSTQGFYWQYKIESSAAEVIELTKTNLVPYFDSIESQVALADALLKQFGQSTDIYELEKTGMACAAAGKYDEAVRIFDRIQNDTNPLKFDWVTTIENRCIKIAELIHAKKFDEIDRQLSEWKAITIKRLNLAGLIKRKLKRTSD